MILYSIVEKKNRIRQPFPHSSFNRLNRKDKKRDKSKKEDLSRCVLKTGLEPVRPNGHWILSPTCLPIPPLQHKI